MKRGRERERERERDGEREMERGRWREGERERARGREGIRRQDPWNLFDLLVVTVSLASLWLTFPGITALRLIRTLRYAATPHTFCLQ